MSSKPTRLRKLTFKAMALYEDNVLKYTSQLDTQWSNLEKHIGDNGKLPSDIDTLHVKSIKNKTVQLYSLFDEVATNFLRFLEQTATLGSLNKYTTVNKDILTKRESVNNFMSYLKSTKADVFSKSGKSSSHNSRARLSAARSKAALAEKSAMLELERIEIEEEEAKLAAESSRKKKQLNVKMQLLKNQEELNKVEEELSETSSEPESLNLPVEDIKSRTANFVAKTLNPDANSFQPTNYGATASASGFSQYLLKKDLLMSRLTIFNERAEQYISWKQTFRNVISEINANENEELDLLQKWLGPNTKRQCSSLRSAYINNPAEGLHKIWERLDERFGTPESIYYATMAKLTGFQKISAKNPSQLYDLVDILSEIEGLKSDPTYASILAHFDSAIGVNDIVIKLPYFLQEKWTNTASNYKERFHVSFPPFSVFTNFVREQSRIRNDRSFMYEAQLPMNTAASKSTRSADRPVTVRKTTATDDKICPIHKTPHKLEKCRVFKEMPLDERKKFLSERLLCFKCFSSQHMANKCTKTVSASTSDHGKNSGLTDSSQSSPWKPQQFSQKQQEPSEVKKTTEQNNSNTVITICNEVCDSNSTGGNSKSCSKIVLANVFTDNDRNNVKTCYCIIDEQSNKSLIKPELFSMLGICGDSHEYLLKTCHGSRVVSGRRANNVLIQSLDRTCTYTLPTLIECSHIPDDKNEICTPDNARCHDHLKHIADQLPDFDPRSDIMLLLGRDIIEAHHVFDQVLGPMGAPYAQRLGLGWVVVGELCLGQIHAQDTVNAFKTYVLEDGRASLFHPCCDHSLSVQDPLFVQTPTDNKVSLSLDDRKFVEIMDKQVHKNLDGSWVAPLPLRIDRSRLPNNKVQVVHRTNTLLKSLEKDHVKKTHFFEFMDNLFRNGHAELAPELGPNDECWYLPIFGVYHPKKPNQVRVVFDSSAKYEGVSLNSVLLQGPDLTNSLLGVLMRFRNDQVAMVADIEQMFYSFSVVESHRNLLRFLWFQDNDPSKALVEYRMAKHVFGNSPSPAIATYCLRKSVVNSEEDIKVFVNRDFYVDDGLSSQPSVEKAVDLVARTQQVLSASKLRLHKIASNNPEVLKQFSSDDLAKGLKDVDLDCGDLPSQRSLGIVWNIENDQFMFRVDMSVQPVTKRGILSTINSLFDPLGFLAPVVLEGRFILRELISTKVDWDDTIPVDIARKWESWRLRLADVMSLDIRRSYFIGSLSQMSRIELHIFGDASERAVSAVAYVVGFLSNGDSQTGFVVGKSKLAPQKGHSIPRLELCASVLATQVYQSVSEQLDVDFDDVRFYTDSRVVLGYICNNSRRFYQYVSNRVQKILHVSNQKQWSYIPSELNPADIGSRGASVEQLKQSSWLKGPIIPVQASNTEYFPLLSPEHDKEVPSEVSVLSTNIAKGNSFASIASKFSSFERLVRAMSTLRHIAVAYHKQLPCKGWHLCPEAKHVKFKEEVKLSIFRKVQHEVYGKELERLLEGQALHRDSSILSLDPKLGPDGLLHVGGRLNRSKLPVLEKNPIVLPGRHPLSRLLVEYYHKLVHHQGRTFTEGAVRSAGFWITGGKRLVSSVIHDCVVCKRLRGRFECQKMSDLPVDRVEPASPFSYVGVDVFGPWEVVARRTRGGHATSKRWAVLFTCLTIRAVHIEVIDEMSSSAFINALRRFVSVRGKVEQFRSDRGSNFVGATDDLNIEAINVEEEKTQGFLQSHSCQWVFNSPHSSHMGGVWERMIGVSRRILEALLLDVKSLTHDVLTTFMAEVSAIINSRPIVPISNDPDVPEVLSPSSLLTMKLESDKFSLGNIDIKDLYRNQWKQVQYLASKFWVRWKKEYLQTLQSRKVWHNDQDPLKVGDIVLLKDSEVARNFWPIARITRTFPSQDGKIRKVEVCIMKDSKHTYYTRPVVELVLLVKC